MDRISLKDALEHDLWEMVWVGEPNREISVEMTYNDLKTIVECLKKGEAIPIEWIERNIPFQAFEDMMILSDMIRVWREDHGSITNWREKYESNIGN